MSDLKTLNQMIKDHNIVMIDLKYSDFVGCWQHVTLPVSAFDQSTLTEGVAFDGSSVTGFQTTTSSDLKLLPDTSTAQLDQFCDVPTLSLICQTADYDSNEWYQYDPRVIAQKATEYMRNQKIATESIWLVELEFYIFNQVAYGDDINSSFYRIESDEGHWNNSFRDGEMLGCNIPHQGGYHAIQPLDRLHNLRTEMTMKIEEAGIPVRYHHHEVGGPGQCEIELTRLPMIKAADGSMFAKHIIKNLAVRRGFSPTFMPKPLYNEAGSGMHFHQNLMDGERNLFFDEKGEFGLSETALYYIGGLLKHGRSLLAFTNPSTNSYKRLVSGFEAPTQLFFGPANRSAAIRIPKYANSHSSQRIEFRPPDATCNLYLAMAAQLMAGLDGIVNKIDPRTLGWGPITQKITTLPPEELARINHVPSSLIQAIEELQKDHRYLTDSGVFPEDIISAWADHKIENEANEVRNRPHPYEMTLYYDI